MTSNAFTLAIPAALLLMAGCAELAMPETAGDIEVGRTTQTVSIG